jgi:hypothetical protein
VWPGIVRRRLDYRAGVVLELREADASDLEAAADRLGLGITAILAAADRYAVAASERFS